MIDVIESPDLRIARREAEMLAARLSAASTLTLGTRVKAGANGKPGLLESISARGFCSIRWDCGSMLCGVEATDIMPHDAVSLPVRS